MVMRTASVFKIVGWVVIGLVGASALALALGFPVMWLWNWLMPTLFRLPQLSFWQAVGLLLLCHLLFKGHHGHHGRDPRHGKPWGRFARRVHAAMEHDQEPVEATSSPEK
jgi:hypothetical protein